ncbi:hypothetical protein [Solibacillus sp. CAU 1738]|uniref:hypothetical protein n=1 Tax=Solibacillus sp. CAU 1738 TaxID=3140363 RepID=UPI003260B5D6
MFKVKKVSKPIVVLSTAVLLAFGGIGIASFTFVYKNHTLVSEENKVATLELGELAKEDTNGSYHLYSVKLSDETKFRKEDWVKILEQIENGEVVLEEEN